MKFALILGLALFLSAPGLRAQDDEMDLAESPQAPQEVFEQGQHGIPPILAPMEQEQELEQQFNPNGADFSSDDEGLSSDEEMDEDY